MVFSNTTIWCDEDPSYSRYKCHLSVGNCNIACSRELEDPESFYGFVNGMSVSLPDEDGGIIVMVPNDGCLSLILHFSEGYRIERYQAENQANNWIYIHKNGEQGGVVIVPNAKAGECYRLISYEPGPDRYSEAEYYYINESGNGFGVEILRAADLDEAFAKRSLELPFTLFPVTFFTCPKEWVSLS